MTKAKGGIFLLAVLSVVLLLNTHVTLLGSGFLVGNGRHILTYHNLVKEAESLKVKFPNEDDIDAETVFQDPASNLAVLKLKKMPKVKRRPLVISPKGLSLKSEPVFTFGYPWANTLQDRHVLIEGYTGPPSMLIEIDMKLDPVHSGSPLFNDRHEVAGMLLLEPHAKAAFPVKGSGHFAIPASSLEKTLKTAGINATPPREENLTREEFYSNSRNNIVLIEAR